MEWLVRLSLTCTYQIWVQIVVYQFHVLVVDTPDSIRGIGLTNAELMKLTSQGGGVGISVISEYAPEVKKSITGNGKSEGVVPWC